MSFNYIVNMIFYALNQYNSISVVYNKLTSNNWYHLNDQLLVICIPIIELVVDITLEWYPTIKYITLNDITNLITFD